MKKEPHTGPLSVAERCKVIGVAGGMGTLLGFVQWGFYALDLPAAELSGIASYLHEGRLIHALSCSLVWVIYVAGLPLLIGLCLLTTAQGVVGWRTVLTKWVVRQPWLTPRRNEKKERSVDGPPRLADDQALRLWKDRRKRRSADIQAEGDSPSKITS